MANINIFFSWPDNDYASVLVEKTKETLFLLLKNIKPILKQNCKEDIARMEPPTFKLRV